MNPSNCQDNEITQQKHQTSLEGKSNHHSFHLFCNKIIGNPTRDQCEAGEESVFDYNWAQNNRSHQSSFNEGRYRLMSIKVLMAKLRRRAKLCGNNRSPTAIKWYFECNFLTRDNNPTFHPKLEKDTIVITLVKYSFTEIQGNSWVIQALQLVTMTPFQVTWNLKRCGKFLRAILDVEKWKLSNTGINCWATVCLQWKTEVITKRFPCAIKGRFKKIFIKSKSAKISYRLQMFGSSGLTETFKGAIGAWLKGGLRNIKILIFQLDVSSKIKPFLGCHSGKREMLGSLWTSTILIEIPSRNYFQFTVGVKKISHAVISREIPGGQQIIIYMEIHFD